MMNIIAFEGIDACGKETQALMLEDWLRKEGKYLLSESFPRYLTPIGKIIRGWLDDSSEHGDLTEETIHMLLEADRQDYMSIINEYEPFCDFMVLDRYILSNLAFGAAKGLDIDWLKDLQSKIRKPDVTFILNISPETSLKRRTVGRDKHEQDARLLSKARDAYVDLYNTRTFEDGMIMMIDGEQSPEQIHQDIKEVLLKHFL